MLVEVIGLTRWSQNNNMAYSDSLVAPPAATRRGSGWMRVAMVSILLPLLVVAVVVVFRGDAHRDTGVELEAKKPSGLMSDYESWKKKSKHDAARGLVLEEPKLGEALASISKLKVAGGGQKAQRLAAAQKQ